MKAAAGLALGVVVLALGAAACGGGGSSYVAKVGAKPITKAQLQAVLDLGRQQYRPRHIPFPRPGSAEYLLLREQALDFLVHQTLAHLADAKLGMKLENRVVTNASFVKVTGGIHAVDAEQLRKLCGAAMHRFVADAERRWPVRYAAGYAPVSEMALARKVWTPQPHRTCDLPPGTYPYAKARAHGCLGAGAPSPGVGSPVCTLIGFPRAVNGFTSAEENDGFADYLTSNAGTCTPDPRLQPYQVQAPVRTTPVSVSYLRGSGTATYRDSQFGWTLRYPHRFHLRPISGGSVTPVDGLEIANYSLSVSTTARELAPGGVEFSLIQIGRGPSPLPPGPNRATFPFSTREFRLEHGSFSLSIPAEGVTFQASLRKGSKPSEHDVAAIRATVSSLRFPALQVGHFAPSGFYVLGRPSAYPLGSVTPIGGGPGLLGSPRKSAPFDLVHTGDGFWKIDWPSYYAHPYTSCGVRFDPRRRQFRCRNGAIWDLEGNVVRNPDPTRYHDQPLSRTPVTVSYDGYVVVLLRS